MFAVYTAGLAAVYRTSRAVSRPDRAGAGGSGRGVAYRSSRAYTTPWPRYTAGGGADGDLGRRTSALAADGANGGECSHGRPVGAASRSSKSFGLHGP
jgi:hypothetical protein